MGRWSATVSRGDSSLATHFRTLLINDIVRADRFLGAYRDTRDNQLAYDIHSPAKLVEVLRSLVASNTTFDAAVFSTHGNKGVISFGGTGVDYSDLYVMMVDEVDYSKLFPGTNSRILFGGCNVADGDNGWKFLFAAARCFLRTGGETIGWTSKGFQAPFGLRDGHIIHF